MINIRIAVILLSISIGFLGGTGLVTLWYADGLSYLSKDPRTCANCHIMQNQYDSWQKASHHTVATCVDCHLPHDFFGKYIAKAKNGYFHSKGFALQDFPEPIRINRENRRILQENCLLCHIDLVKCMTQVPASGTDGSGCVHCHRGVGHGERMMLGGPFKTNENERINQ